MATVYENLDIIKNSIDRMKVALELPENAPLENVTTNVEEVSGRVDINEYFATEIPNTSVYWHTAVKKIPKFTFKGPASSFFQKCNASYIDATGVSSSGQTNLQYMFDGANGSEGIDVSNFDTSNVTAMYGMFRSTEVKSLDLSSFNTSKVTEMGEMFWGCNNLEYLDIRNFDFTNVTSSNYIFGNPNRSSTWVPSSCLIIVKDDTARNWIIARASWLKNIKTIAEL